MFAKSIRWRIQVWHGFLLVLLVTGMLVAFYSYERSEKFLRIDNELHAALTPLLPQITGFPGGGRRRSPPRGQFGNRPPPEDRGPNLPEDGPDQTDQRDQPPPRERMSPNGADPMQPFNSGKFYYISWTPEGNVISKSTNAPADIPFPEHSGSETFTAARARGDFREAIHLVPNGDCVIVGTSINEIQKELHSLAFVLVGVGATVIGLGLFVGWWSAGRVIRPIADISAAAEKIAAGDLARRIDVAETENELGQLASVLNNTFDRLEKTFQEQVRFTADASHELRTPVSVMLTQIQLALSRERSPEEYRKTLETCERAAERMRTLVNQLLELTRADTGEATLIMEKCDLAHVARESLEFIQPLALKKKISLTHSIEPVKMKADVMKLGQVLINLLNNAIQHNSEGVEVSLTVEQNGSRAIIRVADNGVGIPPDALPHLFDRFYRVDKARSRGKGSSGLGLAICKVIVESHGGTIRAQSEPGQGAEFVIELPVKYSASEK